MKQLLLKTIAAVALVGCATNSGGINGDIIMQASSHLAEAARVGNAEEVVILLGEGSDIDERDIIHNAPALQWAAEYGHKGIVEILTSNGACNESTAVHYN
jgi:ankyrin repeat protein